MIRQLGVSLLVLLSCAATSLAEDFKYHFQLVADTAVEGDTPVKTSAKTDLYYSWDISKSDQTLALQSMKVIATQKLNATQKETKLETSMSRNRFTFNDGTKSVDLAFDDAPAPLQTLLRDSFETPICKRKLDKHGGFAIEIVAKEGAKTALNNGAVANASLFHPYFPPDRDQWEADSEMSMGDGGYARGKLKYHKQTKNANQQQVTATGTLTCDQHQTSNPSTKITDARYVIHGEQTFDLKRQVWTAGKLTISMQMTINVGEVKQKHRGDVIATLELLKN